jgi:hypothetical protein
LSYPYAKKQASLKSFLNKIPSIQVPEKLNQQTIYALGFKSKNDRPIITILRFIGFLNSDGVPNENYVNFRSRERAGAIMSKCLKSAYSELFGLYGDANNRTNEELKDFFSTRTKGGDLVQSLTVSTFKTLCEFADFKLEQPKEETKQDTSEEGQKKTKIPQMPQGLAVNMNIQITLPVTEDAKVYENIFKALREQLFKQE